MYAIPSQIIPISTGVQCYLIRFYLYPHRGIFVVEVLILLDIETEVVLEVDVVLDVDVEVIKVVNNLVIGVVLSDGVALCL